LRIPMNELPTTMAISTRMTTAMMAIFMAPSVLR
jgi:hypothetical protein